MNFEPTRDAEVVTLISMLERGLWSPTEISNIERQICDRIAAVRAGVSHPVARFWTKKIQEEVDVYTRLRWDFQNGWTLDRYSEGMWQVVGVLGFCTVRSDLVEYLIEHDMQRWSSPEKYLAFKREKAASVRARNERYGTSVVLEAVDKLSDKSLKNFIEVERAIQTGDTVIMHGSDRKTFDRMVAAGKKAPPGPTSINPGMHPRRYRRTKGRMIQAADELRAAT